MMHVVVVVMVMVVVVVVVLLRGIGHRRRWWLHSFPARDALLLEGVQVACNMLQSLNEAPRHKRAVIHVLHITASLVL
jgi:hypothetical protein